ncbi:hypothetical protein BCR22_07345 [Enterococcus plantarum]|uniref:hypothetical protein n=1 Tax=Enterococcus plantarum TaxID=1077675 RepID=UPI00084D31DF|nr:hypothetical protein [Enterococcus plantarum]MBO0423850.1 hypothetical protein [Enterococcus plantarum]OEG09401.1 hypothetical protein BCR22_07345 [Enterococcus plantarum]
MMNLSAARQEKERGVSVEAIVEDLQTVELEQIAVVGINKNDELVIGYSLDNRLELIGILDALKSKLIDGIHYEQD